MRAGAMRFALGFASLALVCCGSSATTEHTGGTLAEEGGLHVPDGGLDAAGCFPDNDGINGGDYVIDLVVTDTGFYAAVPDGGMKEILATQNDAQVTFTLTNEGTRPHGFKVGCVSVLASYPDLPSGCPSTACFPSNAEIAPLAPGKSATIVFDTPTPDNLLYPFTSNEPADSNVSALNEGQWSLM
jgi:hypothetical protein